MSEETALAKNFAEFSDEQIAAYPQTARSHIVGLAGLYESQSAELSALRERVKELEKALLKRHRSTLPGTQPGGHDYILNGLDYIKESELLSTRREEG